MISFIMLIAVISGFMLTISPVMGLFFMGLNLYITLKKISKKWFFFLTAAVSVSVYAAVENMEYDLPGETLPSFTVIDYKYFRDSIGYVVKSDDNVYELYTTDELSIGNQCSGNFSIHFPGEERNFIKKDDQLRLLMNNVKGRIYEDDIHNCELTDRTFMMNLNQLRHQYIMRILNSTEYDFKFDIITLSIGNKSYIESNFFDALQKLGIYHLYVISGTHVAFVTGVLFFLFKKMRLTVQVIKWLLILSLIAFLAFNFFSPSVFRAVFMAVILLITSMFRKKPYLTVISISALIQILMNPLNIFHAGFQLSYVTTYFILLSRVFFEGLHPIKQLFGITLIAEISTIVIIIIQFNEVSISGILMNLIFVPLFSIIIFPSVILYNIITLFGMNFMAEDIYHYIFTWLQSLIMYLGGLFKHRYPIRNMHEGLIILLTVMSYFAARFIVLQHYKKLMIIVCSFFVILYMNNKISQDDFTISMVDVGQGDAFIVEDHKSDKVMLIDTGGRFYMAETSIKLSEKTILPYLKERGIDKIDMMVITHIDLDHMGEAAHILSKVKVKYIMANPLDPKFNEWKEEINDFNGEFIDVRKIDHLKFGDINVENIYKDYNSHMESSNDYSIVLRLSMNEYSFLMTGDMTGEMEENLLEQNIDLTADVLKLPHHGSNTSSTEQFLETVNYHSIFISAGVNNRYHHPNEEVMARINHVSTPRIYSTKEEGMTRFKIRGDVMCAETKLNIEKNHCMKKDE